MSKTGIFYGSLTGTTKKIAEKLGAILGVKPEDINNVADTSPSKVGNYDNLVLGTSTWGKGALEKDWLNFIAGVEELDLKGKTISLFGCGDETMEGTFCAGVGELYKRLQKTDAEFIGDYDTIGYEVGESPALIDGKAVGLLLDEVNHPEATPLRLAGWVNQIEKEFK